MDVHLVQGLRKDIFLHNPRIETIKNTNGFDGFILHVNFYIGEKHKSKVTVGNLEEHLQHS